MRRKLTLRRLVAGGPEPTLQFSAVKTIEVELSKPLAAITGESAAGVPEYRSCRVLVRLHHHPVGFVVVDVSSGAVGPEELENEIWAELNPAIIAHLEADHCVDGDVKLRPAFPIDCTCRLHGERPDWNPLVSVIICTMGRPRQLKNALDALLSMSYQNYEVIVVDNGPEDASTATLVREHYSDVANLRYVTEPRRGLSAARNRGIGIAEGEILAFTDDDIIVDQYWLSSLVSGFDADGTVACVTGLTLASELESPAQSLFEQYGAFNMGYESRLFKRDANPTTTILYPYTAGVFGGGGNSALRLDCFPEGVRFDRRLGPGSKAFGAEDLDMFLQTILSGRDIRYVPVAIAWHEHRRSYEELRWQLFTYGAGFTALLTKWALGDFRIALDLIRLAPRVVSPALVPSRKEVKSGPVLPADLRRLEWLGFVYGPIAFSRSVFHERQSRGSRTSRRLPFLRRRRNKPLGSKTPNDTNVDS